MVPDVTHVVRLSNVITVNVLISRLAEMAPVILVLGSPSAAALLIAVVVMGAVRVVMCALREPARVVVARTVVTAFRVRITRCVPTSSVSVLRRLPARMSSVVTPGMGVVHYCYVPEIAQTFIKRVIRINASVKKSIRLLIPKKNVGLMSRGFA
jgi:hypothetical protein